VVGAIALTVTGYGRFRRRPASEPLAEWLAVVSTAFLPVFGYLITILLTHHMESRYLLPSLTGFVVVAALVLAQAVPKATAYGGLVAILIVAAALKLGRNVDIALKQRRELIDSLRITSTCQKALERSPGAAIYAQTPVEVYNNHTYSPDRVLGDRFSVVFDEALEMKWRQHGTNAVTARNIASLHSIPVTPWDEMLKEPSPFLLIAPNNWEWEPDEIAARRIAFEDVGPCLRGELLQLHPASTHDR
jgi:hypothetical protein